MGQSSECIVSHFARVWHLRPVPFRAAFRAGGGNPFHGLRGIRLLLPVENHVIRVAELIGLAESAFGAIAEEEGGRCSPQGKSWWEKVAHLSVSQAHCGISGLPII